MQSAVSFLFLSLSLFHSLSLCDYSLSVCLSVYLCVRVSSTGISLENDVYSLSGLIVQNVQVTNTTALTANEM